MRHSIKHHSYIGLAGMIRKTEHSKTYDLGASHNVYSRQSKPGQQAGIHYGLAARHSIVLPVPQGAKSIPFLAGILPAQQTHKPSRSRVHNLATLQPLKPVHCSCQKAAPGACKLAQQSSPGALPGHSPSANDNGPLLGRKDQLMKTWAPAFQVLTIIKRRVTLKEYMGFFLPSMLNVIQWFNQFSALGFSTVSQPFCPGAEPLLKAGNVKGWQL